MSNLKPTSSTSAPPAESLEAAKILRQAQSRNAVISGERSLEKNYFIPREVARKSTYTFKG